MRGATEIVKYEEGGFYVGTAFHVARDVMKLARTQVCEALDEAPRGCQYFEVQILEPTVNPGVDPVIQDLKARTLRFKRKEIVVIVWELEG